MKKWHLLLVAFLLLMGCSMLQPESMQQSEDIPKSYSLAIGYVNKAKWDLAAEQLRKLVDKNDGGDNFKEAAQLLLIHVTNSELQAFKGVNDETGYSELLATSTMYYEHLFDVTTAMENELFLGINYNITAPVLVDGEVDETAKEHYALMSEQIVSTWADVFNTSPVDMKLLLEQSAAAVEQENQALAEQLQEKAQLLQQ